MIRDINEALFNDMMKRTDKVVVVEFWSPSCSVCKEVAPAYEQVAQELEQEAVRVARASAEPVLGHVVHAKVEAADQEFDGMRLRVKVDVAELPAAPAPKAAKGEAKKEGEEEEKPTKAQPRSRATPKKRAGKQKTR
mgnify:CR=1 FL=1